MKRIVVLAGSLMEANAYCRDKGIRAVFAKSSAQVKQADHIIQLAGFSRRRDRFALEQARDSRIKYGRDVRFDDETAWEMPKPPVLEVDIEQEEAEGYAEVNGVYELDLTDQRVLLELKAALNQVGWTLKKLPKKKDEAEAPVVPAPAEFSKRSDISFPGVEF